MDVQHPPSKTTVFLDQPPSCLQFCPAAPDHFVVGTYLLSENKDVDGNIQQTKTGSLQLWKIDDVQNHSKEGGALSLIQHLPLPYAVFDLHFHPQTPSIFAFASSTGSVALFQVTDSRITHLWTQSVHDDPSIPALFLAWTPPKFLTQDQADGFAVTFSDGTTALFEAQITSSSSDGNHLSELGSFAAKHMIEVWFVALATFQDESHQQRGSSEIPFIFTGDDFGSLNTRRLAQKSTEDEDELLPHLLYEHDDRARHHTAGVTSILPLPLPLWQGAPLLLTGSYDEYLRVYNATRKGEVLAEMCLGGGVWRLQLISTQCSHPEDKVQTWKFLVLASCMHAGTRVVRVTGRFKESSLSWEMGILAEFTEHESMNYASDVWKPDGGYDLQGKEVSELLCVSSSFYDRRLCTWRVDV
ncbi:hypothetical protein FE257_000537 [Aspergillus nanangensis]|uniref:Uncharacterized protein n=1 Tax=Aspergillus nanangensis TaxID=2582783 RepID=A0AAD4GXP4_ASPNN|nr:hypothetical protein FE257_000537 [Aspergillus nanangensis]